MPTPEKEKLVEELSKKFAENDVTILADYTGISVQAVKARLDAGEDFILLDVREPFEWEIADIPGATHHIPQGEVLEHLGALDMTRDIVVYCRTGGRSADVVQLLQKHGYRRVKNLAGGINAWARQIDTDIPVY